MATFEEQMDAECGKRPEYECDCCGKVRPLTRVWAFGNMETWACAECRGHGNDPEYEYEDRMEDR